MDIEREFIETRCIEWSKNFLDKSFSFRKYQLEACSKIIYNYLNNIKTQVIEAPTGSGKSLIAIICAGVLWEYYKKKSYILVSDLSLFEQYEKDIERYNLDWGHIKGKDNYLCPRNGNAISSSDCSISNVPFGILRDNKLAFNKGYACAQNCKYIKLKKQAASAPVTICTYQFWLVQQNFVNSNAQNPEAIVFPPRDFIVCDEAHKLPDIVQSHFSPRINTSNYKYLETIEEYADRNNINIPSVSEFKMTAGFLHKAESCDDILTCLAHYKKLLDTYCNVDDKVREKISHLKDKSAYAKLLKAGNTVKDCRCKVSDYIDIANDLGNNMIVKTSEEKEGDYIITINAAFEDKVVSRCFHNKAPNELLMSATIGNFDTYQKMIGMQNRDTNYKTLRINSTFNFDKSPIYISNKYRLSYTEKAKNIPLVVNQVIDIIKKYPNDKGIIQTGSYEFSKALYNKLPAELRKRCISYSDSKDKMISIEAFLKSSNKILVGPTLLEGLNFDGDKCRFTICMKVPYASLGDKLVKAKMNLIPGWYQADVCNKLEQSFGRGVRYNGDYCTTYILDACMQDLIKGKNLDNFNEETKRRFKVY